MLDLYRKLHIFGRGGPVIYALSGLDIALWDIAGKAAGQPLHQMLAGKHHPKINAYASLVRYVEPDVVAANVARAREIRDCGEILKIKEDARRRLDEEKTRVRLNRILKLTEHI